MRDLVDDVVQLAYLKITMSTTTSSRSVNEKYLLVPIWIDMPLES
jgi:hypothetical protein